MAKTPPPDAAPLALTTEEIQHISDAFNFLHHGLREATARFKKSGAQDGGRDGVTHALECVLKFFTVVERTGVYPFIVAEGVHAPIALLFDALMSLDDGKVSLMLARKKRSGRARASSFYNGLKGIAVFTVQRLQATGVNLPEARSMVATVLAKQGIRPARKGSPDGTGQLSGRTLRKWQDDIGLNMEATTTYREAEAAHLKEALEGCGFSVLPTGSTADDLLLQRLAVADLRRVYLERLSTYIVRTRTQETT